MSSPVVSAKNLSLTFETNDGPVHALSDVDLMVEKGDFVSFIGPSGCGKTTFLRVIADLETPTGGEILVNGMSPREARLARSYGYVFQAASLQPWRTIEKNIALPLEIMGYSAADASERIARVLELVDLKGFAKKYPWQLSGGMQQRASIARALAFDADLLLMDEPTAGMAPAERIDVMSLTAKIAKERNIAVLFTEHDMDTVFTHADEVLVLNLGELIAHGTPTEVRNNKQVQQVYLGAGTTYAKDTNTRPKKVRGKRK